MMREAEYCTICQIVARRTSAYILYEDEDVVAYLSARPYKPGATTIVPKQHVDNFFDIPNEVTSKMTAIAARISKKIKAELRPARVSYLVNGYSVTHAHLRIIPTDEKTDIANAVLREDLQPLSASENEKLQRLLSL